MESIKSLKVLLSQGKVGKEVVLFLDEIYIQKDAQFEDGKLLGVNYDGNLIKSVMTFMMNSLKKLVRSVIKAVPEVKVQRFWLSG